MKIFILALSIMFLSTSFVFAGTVEKSCKICGKTIWETTSDLTSDYSISSSGAILIWEGAEVYTLQFSKSYDVCEYCYERYQKDYYSALSSRNNEFIESCKLKESDKRKENESENRKREVNKLLEEIDTLNQKVKEFAK